MEKVKLIAFTVENGIVTTDDVDDDLDWDEYKVRFINKEIGEIQERLYLRADIVYPDTLRLTRLFGEIMWDFRMVRWISAKAIDAPMSVHAKRFLILGYVTAPELYPKEIAAKYDNYIRRNAARLIRYCYFSEYEEYSALINHAFAIGKPSKNVIIETMKRMIPVETAEEKALYKMISEGFKRLYPKVAQGYLDKFAKLESMYAEALIRKEMLKLSAGRVEVSHQTALGKDPDGEKDCHEIYMTSFGGKVSNRGVVWDLRWKPPNKEQMRLVEEIEKEFDVLVYHIHHCRVNEDMVLQAFLIVTQNEDEWEHARNMTAKGLPDCVAPVYGYGGFECSILPIKPIPMCDCLLRTD